MDSKSPFASKTIWVNAAIAASSAAFTVITGAFPADVVAIATPVINIFLRFLSSKKISF